MAFDGVIRSALRVLPEGIVSGDVAFADGRIVAVEREIPGAAREEIDGRGQHLLPGVIDVHVHFNDPGRADWEGVVTGSQAFAAGGGTCFCDMPLNASPPTLDAESFRLKRATMEAGSRTDFALWGGLVPGNVDRLEELAVEGVMGFKAFMCSSGIDDFAATDDFTLWQGMQVAARLGLPVAVHAESDALTQGLTRAAVAAGRLSIRDYLASRPVVAELEAIDRAIRFASDTGCSLHIVHVSTGVGVAVVAEARSRGIDVTCETCPHYLVLTGDDVERLGAVAKCSPPLRDRDEQEALWAALARGDIELIASDHSPSPASMKQGDNFFAIWGGIAGVQTSLGLMLAEGVQRRGLPLEQIVSLLTTRPARCFGLTNKGRIEVGADADFALVDLSVTSDLQENDLLYRHCMSPYLGRAMGGQVRRTIVRGQTVFLDGKIVAPAIGQLVRPVAKARSPSGAAS